MEIAIKRALTQIRNPCSNKVRGLRKIYFTKRERPWNGKIKRRKFVGWIGGLWASRKTQSGIVDCKLESNLITETGCLAASSWTEKSLVEQ